MSDTLAAIRRAIRQSQSAQRRALKHKMSRYDSLANKGKTPDNLYDVESAKTTQDVIEETLSAARQKRGAGRFSVSRDATDRLLNECNVVSPEIREAWHARIGMASLLSDECRTKLQQSAGVNSMRALSNAKRDATLSELARWMVWMWCDEEGYDPDKHPRK